MDMMNITGEKRVVLTTLCRTLRKDRFRRLGPTIMRGKSHVPPESGITPRLT